MYKVTLYTTKTCPFCKMEKDYLNSQNIAYEEVFVDENPQRADEMIAISGQMGVPFTVIEKNDGSKVTILGFDKPK
ncbi:MAG: Glutaredoxin-like protein, YruB-family, partial [Candidatus Curtissbacteria bacterium GW2011_GWA1_40_47]